MGAATLAMPMHAQEESNTSHYSILDHLTFDLDATVGMENKGMTPTTLNFALGYQLTHASSPSPKLKVASTSTRKMM